MVIPGFKELYFTPQAAQEPITGDGKSLCASLVAI